MDSKGVTAPLALGIDIGGTAIKGAVVTVDGELIERIKLPLRVAPKLFETLFTLP